MGTFDKPEEASGPPSQHLFPVTNGLDGITWSSVSQTSPSNSLHISQRVIQDVLYLVSSAGSDCLTKSISSGAISLDATGLKIGGPIQIDYNQAREQCRICKVFFRDKTMLDQHIADTTRTCTRCKVKKWQICEEEPWAWDADPCCTYGCEKHKCCFDRKGEMRQHAEKRTHVICFFEDCTSKYRRKRWHGKIIRKHVRQRH